MKNTIRNYGFKLNAIPDERAYKLGAVELPKVVLRPDGQWDNYLPSEESQRAPDFDTFGCTIYGTENAQQILEIFHNGVTNEYSERYGYNLIKIVPPGADPHDAAESFRNNGVIDYKELPMVSTLAEYSTPRPMSQKYVTLGIAHPWELRHQWLWSTSRTKEERTRLIKEYLKYFIICVSVTAWQEENGVYIDDGQKNTHWTVIYGWNDKGWKVFDSYFPFKKKLSYDHNIEACKGYTLVPSTREKRISIIKQLIYWLKELLKITPQEQPARSIDEMAEVPKLRTTPIPATPKRDLLNEFCLAIQEFEDYVLPGGRYRDGSIAVNGSMSWRNRNPGNTRYSPVGYDKKYGIVKKTADRFAVFRDYETGFLYLKNFIKSKAEKYPNYTILDLISKIYAPEEDNNHPLNYSKFIATKLGVDITFQIKNLLG